MTKKTTNVSNTDLQALMNEVREVANEDEYDVIVTTKTTNDNEKTMTVQTTFRRNRFA